MIKIGSNRLEGIDWVQEQLENLPRPYAEQAYFSLIRQGILEESEQAVSMLKEMAPHELRQTASAAETERENQQRQNAKMPRRRHYSTKRQSLRQLSAVDCVDEDGSESK